jgi:hypothetical protein
MGAFSTSQWVLAILAMAVAFALGFLFRARLGAGTRLARKATPFPPEIVERARKLLQAYDLP